LVIIPSVVLEEKILEKVYDDDINISKTIADRGKCRRPSFFRIKSSKKSLHYVEVVALVG
jgi:hypothetical protein